MLKTAFSPLQIFKPARHDAPGTTLIAGILGMLLALPLATAQAQEFHGGPPGGPPPSHGPGPGGPGSSWHGDIHHFKDYDYGLWRGGRWFHGPHDGRDGWWWLVGDQWYFYTAPIYPYPDPFVPPEVVIPTAPPPNMQYVYYCSDPAGYYPYVRECFHRWHSRVTPVIVAAPPLPPPLVYAPPAPAPLPVPPPSYSSAPVMPIGPGPLGQREADDRQLDAFAVELDGIQPGQPHALSHIKALQVQVAAFHQSLFQHGYNAMDILQDTEGLEHRIADKRKHMSVHE